MTYHQSCHKEYNGSYRIYNDQFPVPVAIASYIATMQESQLYKKLYPIATTSGYVMEILNY